IALWLKGQWCDGLALTGFAYLVIFDAMGVLTAFISSALTTYGSLRLSSIRNPFGALYLLFVALYMLKEGLEHFILESNHEHSNVHSRNLGWLDELMSIVESVLMFYIAIPVASALGKILLQTTPSAASKSLDDCLREILLHPTILSLNATHFWQNSYGQLVGTLHVHVNPDVNEQTVLAFVYSRLSPLFVNGNGELTVQIVK
ncbi:7442_t:CDS:2, partial [Cetraspora pellucida]